MWHFLRQIYNKILQNGDCLGLYNGNEKNKLLSKDLLLNAQKNPNYVIFCPDALQELQICQQLSQIGYKAYGIYNENTKNLPSEIEWLSSENEMLDSVEKIKEKEGKIDLLLLSQRNYSFYGSLEECPRGLFAESIEKNFLSVKKIVDLVLPIFRAQNFGKVVFLGSSFATPMQGIFKINQNAIKSFLQCAMLELHKMNIRFFF